MLDDLPALRALTPLYRAFGFAVTERVGIVLPNGVPIPFVRMTRAIERGGEEKV